MKLHTLIAAIVTTLTSVMAHAAPLSPSSGTMTVRADLTDGDGKPGRFEAQTTLKDGNFNGTARLEIGGKTVQGQLLPKRSYFENGKCYFRLEEGRARAEVGGPCDSATFSGRFETFIPGDGMKLGKAQGSIALSGNSGATAKSGEIPSGKLICAYSDRQYSFKLGETTQYSLHFSNMGSLTLSGNSYQASNGGSGKFTQSGNKVRLTSGTWSGAVGTLEPDRSGKPAVVFHIEENRRPGGVHIVDPYTTKCTLK